MYAYLYYISSLTDKMLDTRFNGFYLGQNNHKSKKHQSTRRKRFMNTTCGCNHFLVKVQFRAESTITAIETQGFPSGIGRVIQYRLEISADCVVFYPIMDSSNNNAVLC